MHAGFIIEIHNLYLSDKTVMPVYIAYDPKIKTKLKPIILYHGHSDGAQTLFGINMTKEYQDYGLEFVKRGFLVVAPDQRGFRQRLAPSPKLFNGYTRSCRQLSFDLMLNGKTLLGEKVADGLILVNYLMSRNDTRKEKIFVSGNSGGGTTSLFHAALDLRVEGVAVGSAFCEFKNSIMEISHCECNYVPGILKCVQEIWQVGALVAPRPMLVIHGKEDKIFPVKYTKTAFNQLKKYYQLSGTTKNSLVLQLHSGAHRYDHGQVFSFIKKCYERN